MKFLFKEQKMLHPCCAINKEKTHSANSFQCQSSTQEHICRTRQTRFLYNLWPAVTKMSKKYKSHSLKWLSLNSLHNVSFIMIYHMQSVLRPCGVWGQGSTVHCNYLGMYSSLVGQQKLNILYWFSYVFYCSVASLTNCIALHKLTTLHSFCSSRPCLLFIACFIAQDVYLLPYPPHS